MAPPTTTSKPKLDVSVTKPTPYTFDLGLLLANDPNPLSTSEPTEPASSDLESQLAATARDGAQALINQLLSTLPLNTSTSGVLLTLPAPTTALPREKPLPAPKEPTRWEQFAARKGIKPKTREQRRAKSKTYNEETGEWERTWGYDKGGVQKRRSEGAVPHDWVVEVDEKKEREEKEAKDKKKRRKKA
ncbi:ribosomal biogenesis regulatory protein [Annulohypoxylon maeteangense]|uniref:ribosomal biogenesis regulatory protein n=1 Tax=Annulohypoxylon maeteangense TaxID=1927788 RepID=UPI00200860B7|nr:ribosomal biogenesis regulatory protein [Annulohypoxylon maeteangense]KAI0890164.1 ribosomal biogenesis regulatory protein [Annulohypoxylon maeteangense]